MSKYNADGMATGLGGRARLNLLRLHRLAEFERAFSSYLAGDVPASRVTSRARKMLAVGLPKLK